MPKQTFFHLPKDKQENLIQAAKKEFSRAPIHEASIANIIKDAKIPRGSFYQYFENKEDVFYYVLTQLSQDNNQQFVAILKEKDGDLFATYIESFHYMINNLKNQENENLFKNVFLNMNYKLENTLANNIYEESQKNQFLNTISLINRKNLNINDEHDLHHILKIIMAVTFHNLVQIFVKDLTDEEAVKNYQEQMELLKKGLCKESDLKKGEKE